MLPHHGAPGEPQSPAPVRVLALKGAPGLAALARAGAHVRVAESERDLLIEAQRQRPQVVLLHQASAVPLVPGLRAGNRDLVVIVATGGPCAGAGFVVTGAGEDDVLAAVLAGARAAPSGTAAARVLIAEDTAGVREVLRVQMRGLGIDAELVADGQAALESLDRGAYGLLLTDLNMPRIDGYELARRVRDGEQASGSLRRMPLVALTADVTLSVRRELALHGFDDVLAKPFDKQALAGVIRLWLPTAA